MCARHVYANLRKKWSGMKYKELFWRICKSAHEVEYNQNVNHMKTFDVGAWEFLERKNPKHFCRLFFQTEVKSDSVDNNMAEVFNY